MPLKKSADTDELRSKILRNHAFGTRSRALILLDISDITIRDFLTEAGKMLDIALLISAGSAEEKREYAGYDAFISDGISETLDVVSLIQSGVVPIISAQNAFSKTFSEFDPMKFEGNAFLFKEVEKYQIFEKLIRYLENIRYAGDKRTLLQNVGKTF